MTICSYDETPARKPTDADVGGTAKLDDAEFPPNPVTDATAADYMQIGQLARRAAIMSPTVTLVVHFTGSTPAISAVYTKIATLVAGSFTVVDNGTGDTSITWAAGTFPSDSRGPVAHSWGVAYPSDATCWKVTHGVRVLCSDRSSYPPPAADIDFHLDIYGE